MIYCFVFRGNVFPRKMFPDMDEAAGADAFTHDGIPQQPHNGVRKFLRIVLDQKLLGVPDVQSLTADRGGDDRLFIANISSSFSLIPLPTRRGTTHTWDRRMYSRGSSTNPSTSTLGWRSLRMSAGGLLPMIRNVASGILRRIAGMIWR